MTRNGFEELFKLLLGFNKDINSLYLILIKTSETIFLSGHITQFIALKMNCETFLRIYINLKGRLYIWV